MLLRPAVVLSFLYGQILGHLAVIYPSESRLHRCKTHSWQHMNSPHHF